MFGTQFVVSRLYRFSSWNFMTTFKKGQIYRINLQVNTKPSKNEAKTPSDQATETNPAKPKPVKSGTSSVQKQKKGGQSGPKKETSFLEMKSLLDQTMTTVLGEIKSLRTEMSICKDQLVILMEDRIHSARERPATPYGLCNPMPCGTKQCHQPYQQRMKKYSDPVQSQQMFYPPNMTPIHPACC